MMTLAGIDEVGRGALFGPVVAAAVLISPEQEPALAQTGVADSKRLSARQRERLYPEILAQALCCRVGVASVAEIDRLNILQASLLAMKRAVGKLSMPPQHCFVDGNRHIPHLGIPQTLVIKGDQTEVAIAAASIIAKVWRDRLIVRLAERYPGYGLATNKGYGSRTHRDALQQLGPTRQHRLSFAPCQLALPSLISEGTGSAD